MAVRTDSSGQPRGLVWSGAVVAAILVIAVLGYALNWFDTGGGDTVEPAAEQTEAATG